MKSAALFSASIMALMTMSLCAGPFELPDAVRLLVISPLSAFVLPIAMSKGPLHTRITRTILVAAVTMSGEFAAAGTYGLLTGSTTYPTEGDIILAPFAISYLSFILFNVIALEGVTVLCRRDDRDVDASLRLPILILVMGTYFASGVLAIRIYESHAPTGLALVNIFVVDLLTLAVSIVALDLTQRELQGERLEANRAAIARQSRHLKSEVLNIASASVTIRRLRHDIANQVDVIDELLDEGHNDTARQYLSDLQDRAQALAQEHGGIGRSDP